MNMKVKCCASQPIAKVESRFGTELSPAWAAQDALSVWWRSLSLSLPSFFSSSREYFNSRNLACYNQPYPWSVVHMI